MGYGTLELYPLNQTLLLFISQTVAAPPHMLKKINSTLKNSNSGYNEHLRNMRTRKPHRELAYTSKANSKQQRRNQ